MYRAVIVVVTTASRLSTGRAPRCHTPSGSAMTVFSITDGYFTRARVSRYSTIRLTYEDSPRDPIRDLSGRKGYKTVHREYSLYLNLRRNPENSSQSIPY